MTLNEMLRSIAGAFVLASVALGYFVHPAFYLFTALVGLILLQSGFARWRPMILFLKKLGFKETVALGVRHRDH